MITFTDPRLYVQGIGTAIMTDPETGDIKFFSDKFQEANIATSADDGIVNAGIGNAPVIMIPSNSNVSVNTTAADYNEYAKAAAVGGVLTYGAPVMTCQQVLASGTSLSISLAGGTPVKGAGMESIVCYVQEVGAASSIVNDGVAYTLDASTGAISGFTATSGKTYLVSYYVSQANASMTTISGNMKGKVVRFVFQRPIYKNVDEAASQGDLYGMMYEIIPRLQLMPDGASNNGNQTSPTTTGITGRAMSYDAETITGECTECSLNGAPLMYRIIVPCDKTAGIQGIIAALGGEITLDTSTPSVQLRPAVVVNNVLTYDISPSDFTYSVEVGDDHFTVSVDGEVTSDGTVAEGEVKVSYVVGTNTFDSAINVTYQGD